MHAGDVWCRVAVRTLQSLWLEENEALRSRCSGCSARAACRRHSVALLVRTSPRMLPLTLVQELLMLLVLHY